MSVASVIAIALFASFQSSSGSHDFDGDGVEDVVSVTVASSLPGLAEVSSGFDGTTLVDLDSDEASDQFGFRHGVHSDLDGDGLPDLVVTAPMAMEASDPTSRGRVYVTRAGIAHTSDLVADTRIGQDIRFVSDHDGDGRFDLLVQGAKLVNSVWIESAVLLSSSDSAVLASVQGDFEAIADLIQSGGRLYFATDLTSDGHVDELDIASFFALGPDPLADTDSDGVVDSADLARILDDLFAGKEAISDDDIASSATGRSDDFSGSWSELYGGADLVLHGPEASGNLQPADGPGCGPDDCSVGIPGVLEFLPSETPVLTAIGTPPGGQFYWQVDGGDWSGPMQDLVLDPPFNTATVTVKYITPDGCSCSVKRRVQQVDCGLAVAACGTRLAGFPASIAAIGSPAGGDLAVATASGEPVDVVLEAGHFTISSAVSQDVEVTTTYSVRGCVVTQACTLSFRSPDNLGVDADADGFANECELLLGTDPFNDQSVPDRAIDSDGDDLPDVDEICLYQSDPQAFDTDEDGVGDFAEVILRFDIQSESPSDSERPEFIDLDGDALFDLFEARRGWDTNDGDMDGDGVLDGIEVRAGTDPTSSASSPPPVDADGDSLDDYLERFIYFTDPNDPDTDSDGLLDGWEVQNGLDAGQPDSDGDDIPDGDEDADSDGLSAIQEQFFGTDPLSADSDRDGISDYSEAVAPADPLDPRSAGRDSAWPHRLVFQGHYYLYRVAVGPYEFEIDPSQSTSELISHGLPAEEGQGSAVILPLQFGVSYPVTVTVGEYLGSPCADQVGPRYSFSLSPAVVGIQAHENNVVLYEYGGSNGTGQFLHPDWARLEGCEPSNYPCPPTAGCTAASGSHSFVVTPYRGISSDDCDPTKIRIRDDGSGTRVVVDVDLGDAPLLDDFAVVDADPQPEDFVVQLGSCFGSTPFAINDNGDLVQAIRLDELPAELELVANGPAIAECDHFFSVAYSPEGSGVSVTVGEAFIDTWAGSGVDLGLVGNPSITHAASAVVWVNSSDLDGDGLRAYRDGFDADGVQSIDDTEIDPFGSSPVAKLKEIGLGLSPSEVPADARLVLYYDASVPGANADPPGGRMRVWTASAISGRDPRSVRDGGMFITPGIEYSLDELGLALTGGNDQISLYVEAVKPSHQIGDCEITVRLVCDEGCYSCATLGLTAMDLEFGPTQKTEWPFTDALPAIDLAEFTVERVYPSADGSRVLADVVVAGTVDDAVADMLEGPEGVVSAIAVGVNARVARLDSSDAPIEIGLEHTKVDRPDSQLAPHDYSGTFRKLLTGLVVDPGQNYLHLEARNAFGHIGYTEVTWYIEADELPIASVTHLDLHAGRVNPMHGDIGDGIQLTIDAGQGVEQVTLSRSGASDLFISSDGGTELTFDFVGGDLGQPAIWSARLTSDSLGVAEQSVWLREVYPGARSFSASWEDSSDEVGPADWSLASFTVRDAANGQTLACPASFSVSRASNPGRLVPLEVLLHGPSGVFDQIRVGGREYDLVDVPGKQSAMQSPALARAAVKSLFVFKDHVADTLRGAVDHHIENSHVVSEIDWSNPDQTTEAFFEFRNGFVVGAVVDAPVKIWDDLAQAVSAVAEHGDNVVRITAWSGHPALHAAQATGQESWLLTEDDLELKAKVFETGVQGATSVVVGAMFHSDVIEALTEPEVWGAVISDSHVALRGLDPAEREAVIFITSIQRVLLQELQAVKAFEAGRFVGQVTMQLAAEIAAGIAAPQVMAAAKGVRIGDAAVAVLARARGMRWLDEGRDQSQFIDAIDAAIDASIVRLVPEGCFVASTKVMTSTGLVNIAEIDVGDRVWARNERTGVSGYRKVEAVSVAIARSLRRLRYSHLGDEVEVVGTHGHPVFSATAGQFVELGALASGDVLLCSGGPARVLSVTRAGEVEDGLVYNLTVSEMASYFVGDPGIWVHNSPLSCEDYVDLINEWADAADGHDLIDAWVSAHLEFRGNTKKVLTRDTAYMSLFHVQLRTYRRPYEQINFGTMGYGYITKQLNQAGAKGLYNFEVHHLFPQFAAKKLWMLTNGVTEFPSPPPVGWQAFLDGIPSFAVPKKIHGQRAWPGHKSIHDVIDQVSNAPLTSFDSPDALRDRLLEAYDELFQLYPDTVVAEMESAAEHAVRWVTENMP